jgi:YesN/AraC family two-component response regulator
MLRAIVVDDEKATFGIIDYIIKSLSIPVRLEGFYTTGDSGYEAIRRLRPDIVFLDIQMPGTNGIEIMRELASERDLDPRIIVVTAYDYFEYAQAALRYGAKDILLKPVERDELVKSLEKVMGFNLTENILFNQIVEEINRNFGEEISLKNYAEKFHTSPQHIARLFRRYFNRSFIKYVNELRINKARLQLVESSLSIKEVAFSVGYNNLNYFYKNFKESTGMTPKEYLSIHRTP